MTKVEEAILRIKNAEVEVRTKAHELELEARSLRVREAAYRECWQLFEDAVKIDMRDKQP